MDKKTRQVKLSFKVTPEQLLKIKNKAKLSDKSMNQLARYLLLNASVEIKIIS